MRIEKDKKGAELTIGTIIVIVLGVVVLVFLIWGFGSGWNNLWGKITAIFGGGSTQDSVKLGCSTNCQSSPDSYCAAQTVKTTDGKTIKGNCISLGYAQGCATTCPTPLITCPDPSYWKSSCDSKTDSDITSTITDSQNQDVAKVKCCVPIGSVKPSCVASGGKWVASVNNRCPQGTPININLLDPTDVQGHPAGDLCCK